MSTPLLPGQIVYDVNAVAYYNVTVPAGQFALLANPLNTAGNTLADVLPNVPTGTQVLKFDTSSQSFRAFTKQTDGSWSGNGADSVTLAPGEGFFLKHNQSLTITYAGEVPLGTLNVQIPVGLSLIASKVPQGGPLETKLGFPAQLGTKVYLYRNGLYLAYTRRMAGWTGGEGGEPQVSVAEAFFVSSPAALTWTRQFTVNP